MLKLITCENAISLKNEVLRRAAESKSERNIIIVPETLSHSAERDLCVIGGEKVSLRAEVLTFKRLAGRVFGEVGGLSKEQLDDGGRVLITKRAIEQAQEMLSFFSINDKKQEFYSKFASIIKELKENSITPEMLAVAAEKLEGQTSRKLQDISWIYAAYCKNISEALLDPADMNTRLAKKINESHFLRNSAVFLYGFSGFTPAEFEIISEILKLNVCVNIGVRFSSTGIDKSGIFAKEKLTVSRLRHAAARADAEVKREVIEAKSGNSDIDCIAQNLFSFTNSLDKNKCKSITLYRAESIYSECEYVASQIKKLVIDKKARYKDIIITARNIESYQDTIKAVFEQYEIPVFLNAKRDVLLTPLFSFILSALKAVDTNFERKYVLSAAKSGYMSVSVLNLGELEIYTDFWDITGNLFTKEFKWHPNGFNAEWNEKDKKLIETLNETRCKIIQPLVELKNELLSCVKVTDFTQCIYSFLCKNQVEEILQQKIDTLLKGKKLHPADEYAQLWNILIKSFSQINGIIGDEHINLREFIDIFSTVLASYSVDTIPTAIDNVTAVGMDNVGFQSCEYLFILGASDGELPAFSARNGLITEQEREILSLQGIELGQTAYQLSEFEPGIITQAIACASKHVYFSYPRISAAGAENRPSYILKRILHIYPDLYIDCENYLNKSYKLQSIKSILSSACLCEIGGTSAIAEAAYNAINIDGKFKEKLNNLCKNQLDYAEKLPQGMLLQNSDKRKIKLSPSRIELFNACEYAYFMKYALNIAEISGRVFSASDYGTFIHYILQKSVDELLQSKEENLEQIINKNTYEYYNEFLSGNGKQTNRFKRNFERMAESVQFIIKNIIEEQKKSLFEPIAFETEISSENGIKSYIIVSNGTEIQLTGKVDRIDGYIKDNTLFIRVVDYKTGAKEFRLSDLDYGLNMQMLLYLNVLRRNIKFFNNILNANLDSINPAGVLYIPAKEPFAAMQINTNDNDKISAELNKELKRSGIILNDKDLIYAMENSEDNIKFLPVSFNKDGEISPRSSVCSADEFDKIERFVSNYLKQIVTKMNDGCISANPYELAPNKTQCDYCSYKAACLFDKTRSCCQARKIIHIPKDEFLRQI